jgi:hypothetical protein
MADPTYLDRLYDEIGQYGDRIKATFGGSGGLPQIAANWATPYGPSREEMLAEQNRLRLQQAKEELMAQQSAGQLSEADMLEGQAIQENIGNQLQGLERRIGVPAASPEEIMQQQDEGNRRYVQYLRQNAAALQGPFLPQDQREALSREEYQKYVIEGQAPVKAQLSRPAEVIPAPAAVAEMAAAMPRQQQPRSIPTLSEVPQEAVYAQQLGQPQRATIKDKIASLPYEADRIDATRKVIQQARLKTYNDALKYVSETYGIETTQGQNALKTIKDSIEENLPLPKPIEEHQQFKSAEKNWTDLRETQNRISKVTGQVEEAQRLMEIDPNQALIHMKANVIKPLNSILSNDAIQLQEMIVRFSDLLSGSELAQIAGKGIFNPTILFNKYLSLDDKEKEGFIEKFTRTLSEANPQRFLDTAINGVNGYINRYNKDLTNQVINITSPTVARQMGAVLMEPLKARPMQAELPATYPQAGVPVAGQQKTAVPLDIEAMRSRYKKQ